VLCAAATGGSDWEAPLQPASGPLNKVAAAMPPAICSFFMPRAYRSRRRRATKKLEFCRPRVPRAGYCRVILSAGAAFCVILSGGAAFCVILSGGAAFCVILSGGA
jgi:hypothetical protein